MTNKEQLQKLILETQQMSVKFNEMQSEMAELLAAYPEEVGNETKFLVTMKYDEIKASDTSTWSKIKELPYDVLVKWEQQIYLVQANIYSLQSTYVKSLGEPGYKQLRSFVYGFNSLLKSSICNPSDINRTLSNSADYYDKCNNTTKKYIQIYFDKLKELILLYENGNL